MGFGLTAGAQTKTESIKVSGNCGSCRKHIETAAKAGGAGKAEWDKKTKILTVTYNASKTSNDAIQKKNTKFPKLICVLFTSVAPVCLVCQSIRPERQ